MPRLPLTLSFLILSVLAPSSLPAAVAPVETTAPCRLSSIHRIGGQTIQAYCGSRPIEIGRSARLRSVVMTVQLRKGPGEVETRGACQIPSGGSSELPRYNLGEYDDALRLNGSRVLLPEQRELVEGAEREIRAHCPELSDALDRPDTELKIDEFKVDPGAALYVRDGRGGYREM